MKLLTILSILSIALPALAASQIEVTSSVSGAPAREISRVFGKRPSRQSNLPRITMKPGQTAVVELVASHRYPTAGGASPTNFKTSNLGGTLSITTTFGAGDLIVFGGSFTVSRLGSVSSPARNKHFLNASTILTREVHFTGQARGGEPVVIDIGEPHRDSGQLTLILTRVKP